MNIRLNYVIRCYFRINGSKDGNITWNTVVSIIRGVIRVILVVLNGSFRSRREVWWWNERFKKE